MNTTFYFFLFISQFSLIILFLYLNIKNSVKSGINEFKNKYKKSNSLLQNRLKHKIKDIVKLKNTHLAKYGSIRIYVEEMQLYDNVKYEVTCWVGYNWNGYSNDVDDQSNYKCFFNFNDIGFDYDVIETKLLNKINNTKWK